MNGRMETRRGSTRAHRRNQAGFSLIEIVATMVIIVVLSVALMVGSRRTHADVAAEAGILRSHLRFVQTMAMANNTCAWGIVVTDSSYTLQRDGLPSPINLPGENAPGRSITPGVQIVQGAGVHTFCPWGCPGETLTITLSDGNQQERITVLAFTGLVQ